MGVSDALMSGTACVVLCRACVQNSSAKDRPSSRALISTSMMRTSYGDVSMMRSG